MSYDFLENERQLSLEDIIMEMQKEILRLRDKINSYEQKKIISMVTQKR